jgi:hypothetical protein
MRLNFRDMERLTVSIAAHRRLADPSVKAFSVSQPTTGCFHPARPHSDDAKQSSAAAMPDRFSFARGARM